MSDLDTLTLPLLPLTTGVVLPGMVVTLTLESPEARAAVDAAASDDDRLLVLVPRLEGRYARVGTIAKIEDLGRIRGGTEALVIRGLGRASIGVGVAGTGEATWVQLEPVADGPASERAETLAREYRATIESIVEARGVPAVAEFLRGLSDPGQIADIAGYSPDLSFERKVEVLETIDVERRLELVLGWAKDTLAEVQVKEKIRDEVSDSLEQRQREAPQPSTKNRPSVTLDVSLPNTGAEPLVLNLRLRYDGERPRSESNRKGEGGARPARAHVRAVARVRLDPNLSRLDDGAAVERAHRGQPGHHRCSPDPR